MLQLVKIKMEIAGLKKCEIIQVLKIGVSYSFQE